LSDPSGIEMNNKWFVFFLDIPISAAVSGVASLIGYTIIQAMPMGLAMAFAFTGLVWLVYVMMLALMYGGPVIVVANGLLKRRLGRIVGPLLLISGLAAYSHATVAHDRDTAAAADTRPIHLDGPLPKIVALEEQTTFCQSHCIQVLANTDFDVVQRPSSKRPWQRFRKVVGLTCDDNAHRTSTIGFIRLGYIGVCSEQIDSDAKVDDAIFISAKFQTSGDWEGAGRFRGDYAVAGRVQNGTTSILGRWINGRIEAPLGDFLGALAAKDVKVGSPFMVEDIYRAAIGIPISDARRPGPSSIPELIAEYERLGDSRRAGFSISTYYESLLVQAGPEWAARHLEPMLNSDNVETRKLALLGLESLHGSKLEFAKPALAKGLQSDDRDEAARSVAALERIPSKERGFAVNGLITAAIRYLGDPDDGWMNEKLKHLLKDAARDLPDFSARLEAWTPADDQEQRMRAAIRELLAR
jgi:hypothetical protein